MSLRLSRKHRNVFLLACALAAPMVAAVAQENTVYTGTIGSAPVAALLEQDAQTHAITSGAYFYRKYGRDIELRAKNGKLLECDSQQTYDDTGCDSNIGLWRVKATAGAIEGEWESADGKKHLPIKLMSATYVSKPEEEFLRLRLENGKQKESVRKSLHGISWIVRTDVRSGQSMPVLVAGASEAVLRKINAALQKEFENDIGEALSAADYSATHTVVFANSRLFALQNDVGFYYMGAAHPSSGTSVTVYDLGTGDEVDLKKFFRMATTDSFDSKQNDLLDVQILRAYRDAAEQDKEDPDCFSLVVERFDCKGKTCRGDALKYANLYPTDDGLAVSVDVYSEAERACRGENVVLPWANARKALIKPVQMP